MVLFHERAHQAHVLLIGLNNFRGTEDILKETVADCTAALVEDSPNIPGIRNIEEMAVPALVTLSNRQQKIQKISDLYRFRFFHHSHSVVLSNLFWSFKKQVGATEARRLWKELVLELERTRLSFENATKQSLAKLSTHRLNAVLANYAHFAAALIRVASAHRHGDTARQVLRSQFAALGIEETPLAIDDILQLAADLEVRPITKTGNGEGNAAE